MSCPAICACSNKGEPFPILLQSTACGRYQSASCGPKWMPQSQTTPLGVQLIYVDFSNPLPIKLFVRKRLRAHRNDVRQYLSRERFVDL